MWTPIAEVAHCSSPDEYRRWAHNGTYVDFSAKEINTRILFLTERGRRAREIADYIFGKVCPRLEPQGNISVGDRDAEATYPSFSFLPVGLGKIREFQVRVHVGASCGPHAPRDLDSAVLGASVIVVATANEPTEYRGLVECVVASPAYFEKTPVVLFVEDANPDGVERAVSAPVSLVIPTRTGMQDYFLPLRGALKLALERLKESSPADDGPTRLVALAPLVDVLRDAEKKKGGALTKDEVLEIRDNAKFMVLSPSRAAEIERRRGYADVDPAEAWEQWQAWRSA